VFAVAVTARAVKHLFPHILVMILDRPTFDVSMKDREEDVVVTLFMLM